MTNEEIVKAITELEMDRDKALEGVSNFRAFQLRMEKHMGFQKALATICSAFFTVFLAFSAWALSQIVPAAKLVIEDYYRNHPASKIQSSSTGDQVYAHGRTTDAGNGMSVHW